MSYSIQRDICKKYSAEFLESPPNLKVGIDRNVKDLIYPLNGLRHPPEGDTTGWYIWAGLERSSDKDFFMPLHVEHLFDFCPEVLKYLGLAPGWRFLIDPNKNYEDVWYDEKLFDI